LRFNPDTTPPTALPWTAAPQQQPAQQPEQQTQPAQPVDASTQVDFDQARWQKMVQGPFANISQQNQQPKQAGFS
jgi:hypothetical protein